MYTFLLAINLLVVVKNMIKKYLVICFVLVIVILSIILFKFSNTYLPEHTLKYKKGDFRLSYTVAATSEYDNNWGADKAFDGNFDTAWAVYGSSPVNLIVKPAKPVKLMALSLFSKETIGGTFIETWHKVKVTLLLKNKVVLTQDFYFKNANKEKSQNIVLKPVLADQIKLGFSKPVKVNKNDEKVDPKVVYNTPPHPPDFCPNYTEIVMDLN